MAHTKQNYNNGLILPLVELTRRHVGCLDKPSIVVTLLIVGRLRATHHIAVRMLSQHAHAFPEVQPDEGTCSCRLSSASSESAQTSARYASVSGSVISCPVQSQGSDETGQLAVDRGAACCM
jgi:hypothetical protein